MSNECPMSVAALLCSAGSENGNRLAIFFKIKLFSLFCNCLENLPVNGALRH